MEQRIRELLQVAFQPSHVELLNESHNHGSHRQAGHVGNQAPQETHFRLVLVSAVFEGLSRLARQRRVNEVLASEYASGLHALTQQVFSPTEWQNKKSTELFQSPPCHGGSKRF